MNINIRKNILGSVIFILGLAATLMLFFTVLVDVNTDVGYSGVQVVFGGQIYDLGVLGTVQIEPSVLGIFAFLIPVLAGLLAIFVKKSALISTGLFIGATILLFLIPTYTETTLTVLGNTAAYETPWAMGSGLIVAGILSIFGIIVSLYAFLIYSKLLKK